MRCSDPYADYFHSCPKLLARVTVVCAFRMHSLYLVRYLSHHAVKFVIHAKGLDIEVEWVPHWNSLPIVWLDRH